MAAVAAMAIGGATLAAQGTLASIGLTETAARTFLIDGIKSPATGRGSGIVVAGTAAFLKLPASARGATAPCGPGAGAAVVNSASVRFPR
jgi:hypothetical protein